MDIITIFLAAAAAAFRSSSRSTSSWHCQSLLYVNCLSWQRWGWVGVDTGRGLKFVNFLMPHQVLGAIWSCFEPLLLQQIWAAGCMFLQAFWHFGTGVIYFSVN
ncbi:unnamed protein product [Effrenium voratum]|nr:unnamed protein product [Effrenium voratum]